MKKERPKGHSGWRYNDTIAKLREDVLLRGLASQQRIGTITDGSSVHIAQPGEKVEIEKKRVSTLCRIHFGVVIKEIAVEEIYRERNYLTYRFSFCHTCLMVQVGKRRTTSRKTDANWEAM